MTEPFPDRLRPDELDWLQTALAEQMEASGCMSLDAAHGFLSATAGAGDDGSEAAELDRVLGGLSADVGLRDLLSRFRAQLLIDLQRNDFGPLILQMPCDDGSMLPLPYGWCQGYIVGIEFLGRGERDRMLSDERAGSLLLPALSFLMYEESQWLEPPDENAHRETVGELGAAAVALYHWRKQQLHS